MLQVFCKFPKASVAYYILRLFIGIIICKVTASIGLHPHCPKNIQNLCTKTEPVMIRTYARVSFWFLWKEQFPKERNTYTTVYTVLYTAASAPAVQARFLCNSAFSWYSVQGIFKTQACVLSGQYRLITKIQLKYANLVFYYSISLPYSST